MIEHIFMAGLFQGFLHKIILGNSIFGGFLVGEKIVKYLMAACLQLFELGNFLWDTRFILFFTDGTSTFHQIASIQNVHVT